MNSTLCFAAAMLLGAVPAQAHTQAQAQAQASAAGAPNVVTVSRPSEAMEARIAKMAAEVAAQEARVARSAAGRDKKAAEEAKARLQERRAELMALKSRAAEMAKIDQQIASVYLSKRAGADDVRVSLDLGSGASVHDALKAALDQSKQEYVLDDDLPKDWNVTLKVQNARLETVLDLITQTAGVGWRRETRAGKPIIRVGKSITTDAAGPVTVPILGNMPIVGNLFRSRDNSAKPPDPAMTLPYTSYVLSTKEQRATFTCPHCKGQSTVVRRNQQPKCTACSRTFEAGWKFCPADGTKRPPVAGAWKFCPMCGKTVQMEQALVAAPHQDAFTFSNTITDLSIGTPDPHAP